MPPGVLVPLAMLLGLGLAGFLFVLSTRPKKPARPVPPSQPFEEWAEKHVAAGWDVTISVGPYKTLPRWSADLFFDAQEGGIQVTKNFVRRADTLADLLAAVDLTRDVVASMPGNVDVDLS